VHITTDAVVIGAGVIGSSVALELSRGGRRVHVVDKAGGVGMGSTSASSAIVRFNYSTWAGVAASWEAWHGWKAWPRHLGHADESGLAEFVRTGMLVIASGDQRPERSGPLFDQAGVPWELWSAEDVARRLPYLDRGAYGPPKPVRSPEFFDDAHGQIRGLYTPDAGFVSDPQLAAHNLAEAARASGAEYLLRTQVVAVEPAAPAAWSVVTHDGDVLDAAIVVNAAGPWSTAVNTLAGVGDEFTVTARPLRQEVHRVPAPPGFRTADPPGVTIADPDLGIYVRGDTGGLLVGGMEPACDPLEWLDDPDTADPRVTVGQFEAQVLRASRRMPGLRVPNRPSGIAGVYDASTDWAPIYDRTDAPGFYVAMGTSGNQFKNAPVVGQFMAAIVDAVEAGHDHDADPLVFTGPHTGLEIPLAAFSRRRPVEPGGPSSVLG
jgi:glycine/D-amino acid oxidase-like deaminating enzyme